MPHGTDCYCYRLMLLHVSTILSSLVAMALWFFGVASRFVKGVTAVAL